MRRAGASSRGKIKVLSGEKVLIDYVTPAPPPPSFVRKGLLQFCIAACFDSGSGRSFCRLGYPGCYTCFRVFRLQADPPPPCVTGDAPNPCARHDERSRRKAVGETSPLTSGRKEKIPRRPLP